MLRSGPFSDERIVGLLNSRFVPFYFDLAERSPASDAAAKTFVVAVKEELGKRSVPTPPVLLMSAEGELLAEVSNYASEQEMLAALRGVLKRHPEYASPATAEAELPRLERARLAHWLGDDAAAKALLQDKRSSAESLLLAQIARRAQDFEGAGVALEELDAESNAGSITLERALIAFGLGSYELMPELLRAYPEAGPRAAEAQYYLGLAQFHLDDPKQARASWKALVKHFGEARWSYRADWAYCQTTDAGTAAQKRSFFVGGATQSLLGRHGYMGRQNPDLTPKN